MNTTNNDRRLAALAKDIARLDADVVNAERAALDLRVNEHDCALMQERASAVRIELDRALRAYFIESEVVRRGTARVS